MAEAEQDFPIYDILPDLEPPHRQRLFFGHTEEEQKLLSSWQSGKMHHAWLLTGPKGIGKATFAFRAARFLFNEGMTEQGAGLLGNMAAPTSLDSPDDSQAVHLVTNLAHPNLLVIDRPYDQKTKRFKTEITVDEVRRTVRFFGSTAGEKTWRVCIVDPADDLNNNAANALLKILEEPPVRTIFFLISHAPGRLLPTIRSRCAAWAFHHSKTRYSARPSRGLALLKARILCCSSAKAATGPFAKQQSCNQTKGLCSSTPLSDCWPRLIIPTMKPSMPSQKQ